VPLTVRLSVAAAVEPLVREKVMTPGTVPTSVAVDVVAVTEMTGRAGVQSRFTPVAVWARENNP